MSCAKHMIEREEERRYRRNEMASCRRWGIEYREPEEPVVTPPPVITINDVPSNTLFYIRTYVNDKQYLYRKVYFDQIKKHFYYYYIEKNGNRRYEIIPYENVTDIHLESKKENERDDSLTVDYTKLKQIDIHVYMDSPLYNGRRDSMAPGVNLRDNYLCIPDNLIPYNA